jgi:hypothetical protein
MEQNTALNIRSVEAQEVLEWHHALSEVCGLGDPVVFVLAFISLLLFA